MLARHRSRSGPARRMAGGRVNPLNPVEKVPPQAAKFIKKDLKSFSENLEIAIRISSLDVYIGQNLNISDKF